MKTWAISVALAVAAPLAFGAAPAQAADDGYGNTFNVRESHVRVIGDRCASIHYSVDGWSAGYDADDTMGSAFVTVEGAGIDEIEMYDWWDWSLSDWDFLSWNDERRVCVKRDTVLTIRAEFDVFPDTDLYDYDDGYSTSIEETVNVNYQPVSITATSRRHNLLVRVRKDGESWRNVALRVDGLQARTNGRGVAMFSKRRLPKGHVKVTVGASPAYAVRKVRVS
jgi:hypothetical protein